MGNMSRHKAREQAFKLVFNKYFNKDMTVTEVMENMALSGEYVPEEFSERLFEGTIENIEPIDKLISENLVKWKIERLSKAVLAILEMAIYEILYCEDIPDAVSINEAVELTKIYGEEEDFRFVNGMLGNIARQK